MENNIFNKERKFAFRVCFFLTFMVWLMMVISNIPVGMKFLMTGVIIFASFTGYYDGKKARERNKTND